ncbi:MAG: peptidylprolyl isomerase [Clostridiales bacterium]|nr:peptidylprolyl isomerase [Clostridiales bacterium]
MLALVILFSLASCGSKDAEEIKVSESGKYFIIELYPEYAPKTVENFLKLVNEGFYNGLKFHRVIAGFMAQGGSPDGTSSGSATSIEGEFASNGFTRNTLKHERGTVSMARGTDYNSASCQFFICFSRQQHLDDDYAAFGSVVEGMDVVDGFLDIERTYDSGGYLSVPVTPIVMKTVEQISDGSDHDGHPMVKVTMA